MAWSTPNGARATGYLVTAGNWNELALDLQYLKGQAGTVAIEAGASFAGLVSSLASTASYQAFEARSTHADGNVYYEASNGTTEWTFGIDGSAADDFYFYSGGNKRVRLFPSGGVVVGPTPSDPGANNLRVQGTLGVGSSGQAAISATGLPSGTLAPRTWIPATALDAYAAVAPTFPTRTVGSYTRAVARYADVVDSSAQVWVEVPHNYGGGTITCYFLWLADVTSGAVVWHIVKESAADGAAYALASVATLTDTVAGTAARINIGSATWTTNLPAAGDYCSISIQRISTNVGDTLADDADLVGVMVVWG